MKTEYVLTQEQHQLLFKTLKAAREADAHYGSYLEWVIEQISDVLLQAEERTVYTREEDTTEPFKGSY